MNASQLVILTDPRGAAAEAYRMVGTNLCWTAFPQTAQVILFTAPGVDEGNSTAVANVAVATAQAHLDVVLVDCDLRRPTLHAVFGVSNGEGISSLLSDGATERRLSQQTTIPGLRVLPSGPLPSNPTELLSSDRLGKLLGMLKAETRLVLLDAPPVTAVADTSILARSVDGVVLVVNARRTRRDEARRAKAQLELVHANILGVLITNARR